MMYTGLLNHSQVKDLFPVQLFLGTKWKTARRIIQPLLNVKFITDSMTIFQEHIEKSIAKIEEKVEGPAFCIHNLIHTFVVDIIGETLLGTKINAQEGEHLDVVEATTQAYIMAFERIVKPWLQPNLLFQLSGKKKKQNEIINHLHGFFKTTGQEAKTKFKNGDIVNEKNYTSSIYPLIEGFQKNKNILSDYDYLCNLVTLYAAAEDTVSAIACSACMCFGMYPQYQAKVVDEIHQFIGKKPRHLTYEEINNLPYLDMCLKEVFRLFPIAPFIVRKTTEDFQIDKWTLPPGCAILVPIFNLHFDPEHWENPMHFHPDHFLPEIAKKRHIYAYVPFSAGPRGCIGKLFANASIKTFLINILQRYELEAEGDYPYLFENLRADITVRPKFGYPIRLKHRKWK